MNEFAFRPNADARHNNYPDRIVADIRDKVAWTKHRTGRIGGSDAAKFAKEASAHLYLKSMLQSPFVGNQFTNHGNDREAAILRHYRLDQNHFMFRSPTNERFVATPDSIRVLNSNEVILSQAKTTSKPMLGPIPAYQRQMWWEQMVMDTDRTLFVWEQHEDFRAGMEPESVWFYRDEDQIAKLVRIGNIILEGMDAADEFRKEMES